MALVAASSCHLCPHGTRVFLSVEFRVSRRALTPTKQANRTEYDQTEEYTEKQNRTDQRRTKQNRIGEISLVHHKVP